jgi:hypothetical protein
LGVTDQREVAVAQLDGPAGDLAPYFVLEQQGDGGTPRSSQVLARQPDEGEQLAFENASDLEQGRPRPVGERHRHHHQATQFLVIDGNQQVARERPYRVAQRLARMALGIEAEILVELLQALAQDGHAFRRDPKRFAGPKPRMNTDAGDLAVVLYRYNYEVERHSAVDRRLALGLCHKRDPTALFEVAHGAEAASLVGRSTGNAEDAERFGRGLVRLFDMVAEKRHGAVGEPVEQFGALGVGGSDRGRVLAHLALELGPVADREPDIVQHALQVGGERLALAGVDAVELEVHHRFPPALVRAQWFDVVEHALTVAVHADDGMEQPVDRDLLPGNGIGDRIHQEWHIVIDDGDAHSAVARFAAGRLDRDLDFAWGSRSGHLGKEFSSLALGLTVEAMGFARQGMFSQRLAN